MIERDHLYKGYKPVHWCVDCGSSLAEAEVEYEDKTSPAVDVRFAVADENDFLARMQVDSKGSGPLSVVIWTTTPWTLPANQAVALNAELDYVLIEMDAGGGAERVLLAEDMVEDVLKRYGVEQHKVLANAKGQTLEGAQLLHPFYDRQVPIILGEHVTTDAGTGAVHTAPGHGQEDFAVGKHYGLPVENPVGGNGVFLPNTELFAGQHVFKANDTIIAELETRGKLLRHEPYRHSYPHCWRHKSPVIFRATPQWFIGMETANLRKNALEEVKKVAWMPGWGESRMASMVENRPDWCISRQRTWGVPIALFIHKETQALHPRSIDLLEQVAGYVEEQGIDAWFDLEAQELLGDDAADYEKVTDILDVWFDSGVVHYCVLEKHPELGLPADLYLEGSDQHRGWFQSSLLTSVAMRDKAPYRAVLTHGFTVDEKGHKMSKSRGNVVAPQKVMNKLGADVLRLWVAATDYSGEMSVSDSILQRVSDSYRRLRNTSRFLLANLHGFDPAKDKVAIKDMLALDQWAVQRAAKLQDDIVRAYEEYEFHMIYQKLHNFCVVDMGGFYLDVIKDRQYTTQADSLARRSCQTAMYHIIEAMVRWLAPILTFTAEELWQHIPGKRDESVFFETWYDLPTIPATDAGIDWDTVLTVRQEVSRELEALRKERIIGGSLDAEVTLYCEPALQKKLAALGDELKFALIVSAAHLHDDATKPDSAIAAQEVAGLWIDIKKSDHAKCVRCWHHTADVGKDENHPELCARCVTNVAGEGEKRRFA
ncbi:MAG TPA: isoleucine--tRNA ligase, partial [Gammaproteobacteria bacterium]|nr:isoleucine--tRNA ligase [Gammaproteobacteria bacterium]